MKKNKAIFLDRDRVINEMVYNSEFGIAGSPHNTKEFKFLDGIVQEIKIFNHTGF